jgi:hypothetical protein
VHLEYPEYLQAKGKKATRATPGPIRQGEPVVLSACFPALRKSSAIPILPRNPSVGGSKRLPFLADFNFFWLVLDTTNRVYSKGSPISIFLSNWILLVYP